MIKAADLGKITAGLQQSQDKFEPFTFSVISSFLSMLTLLLADHSSFKFENSGDGDGCQILDV